MKRRFFPLLSAAVLAVLLSGCGRPAGDSPSLTVAATTYPVYLFTTAIAQGAEGVEVELLINQQTSCLHDYTLTIRDMKLLDRADAVFLSGAGLEDFLDGVLPQTGAAVLDCSAGFDLLPADEDGHPDHDEYDPHYWLSVSGAAVILENIASGLSDLDPEHAPLYAENLSAALESLPQPPDCSTFDCPCLITFHDGFRYFAADCGLTILQSVEEEEGSEASAADLKRSLALVREYGLPAVFSEANGSDRAAKAVARETGCQVFVLDTIMSGSGTGLQPWLDAMQSNYQAVTQALGGQ